MLFRVHPNFHKCLYNSKETRITFSISFRKQRDEKRESNLLTLIIKMQFILFALAITTSTARASSVSPSRYTNTIFNQSVRVLS